MIRKNRAKANLFIDELSVDQSQFDKINSSIYLWWGECQNTDLFNESNNAFGNLIYAKLFLFQKKLYLSQVLL